MDQPTINSSSSEGPAPFEMPPNITAPEPMGQKPGEQKPAPVSMPAPPVSPNNAPLPGPKKPIFSYIVIIFLLILLFVGTLFFARWKGWIFKSSNPVPSPTVSPKISPAISSVLPTASPTASSSSETTVNINDQTRKKDLANLKDALKKYYAVKAEYPVSTDQIKTSDQTSILAQALAPTYLQSLPNDPSAPKFYYGYKSDGQNFELTAVLEDKSDSTGTLTGSYNIYKVTNSSLE
ncbi:MAG: type II secretion system protein GspG [Patescibacteria group bacterium]|nr:type II secretion system protein GspG [Patescibacteria group bacterium]